ncbi:MAG: 30S ribosomal protein S6 [Bacteroidales bacterium]|nr:30S ribosomal protein S6 [Bacteroidales bacterium]
MNQYETVFILTPVLSDTQVKESVEKYEQLIKDNGGEIVNKEAWGLKKLAYTIQKKNTGFYFLYEFKAEGEFVDKLTTAYKRDERVIRSLVVKLDKHGVAYTERKRNKVQEPAKTE